MMAKKAPITDGKRIARADIIPSQDGLSYAMQITLEMEIDMADEKRIRLLLCAAMKTVADVESKIAGMKAVEVAEAFERLNVQVGK